MTSNPSSDTPTSETHRDVATPFLIESAETRGVLVHLEHVWQDLIAGRPYPPAVRSALGTLAVFVVALAARLKTPTRVTVQAQGKGAVNLLVVDLSAQRCLRATAQLTDPAIPIADDTSLDALLGPQAQLAVVLDLPETRQSYVSLIPWQGHTLNETLEAFLAQSEQQPARFWSHCSESFAAGLLLSALPARSDTDPDGWNRVQMLALTVRPDEWRLDAATLLSRLFAEENVRVFESIAISGVSHTDLERIKRLLQLLGFQEVQALLQEQGGIHIRDELSGQSFFLTAKDIARMGVFAPESARVQ